MNNHTDDQRLLLETVQKFMADEIYPYEEKVDKLGHVPEEIGKQIERGFFRLEIRVFVVYVRILSQFMRGSSQFKHYFFWLQIDNT